MRIIPEVLSFTNTLELKGMSPNIVKGYLYDLKNYYMWLEQEGLQFYEVKPKHLSGFIEFIDSRSASGRVSPPTLSMVCQH